MDNKEFQKWAIDARRTADENRIRRRAILDRMTNHERYAIVNALRIALTHYKEDAANARVQPLESTRRVAGQFDHQAKEAEDLLAWMED